MSEYATGGDNFQLSEAQVNGMVAFLQERLGCFRMYAMDLNGNEMFLTQEQSGMETRALRSLICEVESTMFDMEVSFIESSFFDEEEEEEL
jgi:hypothetical protein